MDSNFALFCLSRILNPSKWLLSENVLEAAEPDFALSSLGVIRMHLPSAIGLVVERNPVRPAFTPGRFWPRPILAARNPGLQALSRG